MFLNVFSKVVCIQTNNHIKNLKKKIIYIISNIQHLFYKIIYLCYIIHTNYADPK